MDGNPQFILAPKLKALKKTLKLWSKITYGQVHKNILAAEASVLSSSLGFSLERSHGSEAWSP